MESNNPGVAATVVVFARKEKEFLMIKRKDEPFLGAYGFPGGFIETGKETVEQAGVRELEEETGVSVDVEELKLLDARSDPGRDPRGHVIDIGFLCILEKKQPARGSEETFAEWIPQERMDSLEYSFDHKLLWRRVKPAIKHTLASK